MSNMELMEEHLKTEIRLLERNKRLLLHTITAYELALPQHETTEVSHNLAILKLRLVNKTLKATKITQEEFVFYSLGVFLNLNVKLPTGTEYWFSRIILKIHSAYLQYRFNREQRRDSRRSN